jgi:hypothetical protein
MSFPDQIVEHCIKGQTFRRNKHFNHYADGISIHVAVFNVFIPAAVRERMSVLLSTYLHLLSLCTYTYCCCVRVPVAVVYAYLQLLCTCFCCSCSRIPEAFVFVYLLLLTSHTYYCLHRYLSLLCTYTVYLLLMCTYI